MFTRRFSTFIALAFLATSAQALLLHQESFEDPARALFSVEGGAGSTATDFFAVTGPGLPFIPGFSVEGVDGERFFAGRDLNGFGATAPHRVVFDPVDVSGFTGLQLTVALAAVARPIYERADALVLEYSGDGGHTFFTLDRFSGARGGALLSNGVATLGATLTDFSYALPEIDGDLVVRIGAESFLTGNEAFAFDDLRLFGVAKVEEPATWLLLAAGVALVRRSRSSWR